MQDTQGRVRILRKQSNEQSEQLAVFEVGAVDAIKCGEDGRSLAAASPEVVGNLGQREAQHSERLGNIRTQAFGQLLQIVDSESTASLCIQIIQSTPKVYFRGALFVLWHPEFRKTS